MPEAFCSSRRFQSASFARMSTPATPSSPNPAGDDRNLVAAEAVPVPTFEDKLEQFWGRNRTAILALCGLIVAGIIGKGVVDHLAKEKDLEIGKAYAAAGTSDQLKAFASANSGHILAGVARLRLADEAFAAGKAADAVSGYEQALAVLKDGPLAARAKLGRAVAKLQSGKAAEAAAELKQLADDASQPKPVRAEAAYNLTGIAVDAGNAADAQKYVDQLNQLDPMGPWSQRAIGLRATLPATPAPAAPKTEAAAPAVQVKLPGK